MQLNGAAEAKTAGAGQAGNGSLGPPSGRQHIRRININANTVPIKGTPTEVVYFNGIAMELKDFLQEQGRLSLSAVDTLATSDDITQVKNLLKIGRLLAAHPSTRASLRKYVEDFTLWDPSRQTE